VTELYQDIQYRQSDNDPNVFFFIPGSPSPEIMSSGNPAASMIGNDNGGVLQLGVHWDVSGERLRSLGDYLRGRFQLAAPPQLTMDRVSVDAVKLDLSMPDGRSESIASTTSSGYLPFAALFNVPLDAAHFGQSRLAMTGRQQILKVTYEISGQSLAYCTATISGDARQDVQDLQSNAEAADCRRQIDTSLVEGRLQLAVTGDDVSDAFRTRVVNAAKDQASGLLQKMLGGNDATLDAAHLESSVTLAEARPAKMTREADIGTWFGGMSAANILITPSSPDAPSVEGKVDRTIRLGFEPKDFPIAFIQITSGNTQAALSPPVFSPVRLTVQAGKPVTVKVNYTNGGSAYQAQVEAASEPVALMPQQLGFCAVNFNGTARKEAGSSRIKIRAKYRPSGNGSEDETVISWGFGDWTETWYVVSRDSGLAGVIEYTWQETAADGSVVEHPAAEATGPEVKL